MEESKTIRVKTKTLDGLAVIADEIGYQNGFTVKEQQAIDFLIKFYNDSKDNNDTSA